MEGSEVLASFLLVSEAQVCEAAQNLKDEMQPYQENILL